MTKTTKYTLWVVRRQRETNQIGDNYLRKRSIYRYQILQDNISCFPQLLV